MQLLLHQIQTLIGKKPIPASQTLSSKPLFFYLKNFMAIQLLIVPVSFFHVLCVL